MRPWEWFVAAKAPRILWIQIFVLIFHAMVASDEILEGGGGMMGFPTRRIAVFHIPRTSGKCSQKIVRVNDYEDSVRWRGDYALRQTQSHRMLIGRLALSDRNPISCYQSQEIITKGMAEPNPMKLLSREGRDGLEGALERMQSA